MLREHVTHATSQSLTRHIDECISRCSPTEFPIPEYACNVCTLITDYIVESYILFHKFQITKSRKKLKKKHNKCNYSYECKLLRFFYTKPMRGTSFLVHTFIRTYFNYQRFTFLLFFSLFTCAKQTYTIPEVV